MPWRTATARVIKHTRFHSGVKFIDRSVNGHGIFEVRKCFHEELVGLGILQIVVCDPPGLALQFNKIRGVRADQVDLRVSKKQTERLRVCGIPADDGMFSKPPDVTCFGKAGLLQLGST